MNRQWLFGRILALALLLSLSLAACIQPVAAPSSTSVPQPASPVEFVRKIDTAAQQIKAPCSLAVDGEGNVYITDGSDTPRVLKYDSQGNFVLSWGSRGSGEGQFEFLPPTPDAGPSSCFLAVDAQGNVYVTDAYNFRVQKFDGNGNFLMQFGSKGSGEGQFDEPSPGPLYVDSQGNIYVSTFPRVQKFDATGQFLAEYGKAGTSEGEFNGAAITTIDDQGNLYMADALNHRMQKLDPTGTFLLQWGSEGTSAGQFAWPVTAVLDRAGRLYVADNTNRIQIFDTEGKYLGQWSEPGNGDPPFGNGISGLAIDGQDNIYVADYEASHNIYVFRPRTLTTAPPPAVATEGSLPDLEDSPLQITSAMPYGEFNGIDYVKYAGHFVNTTDGEPFDAPFEIIVPADPSQGNGRRIILLLTEADVILWHAELLRDDGAHPNYRSYEVAGASHIPGPLYDPTQLDWLPIVRALFVAGDQWVMEGVEPPASVFLEQTTAETLDPVYQRPTGIARDENLNAKGGIRLPDLALGRSQFIAIDVANFVLVGKFIDLKCEPLPDGSNRFPDHATYVNRFTQETQRLVAEGFLLPEEAKLLIEAAQASGVGTPAACA